MKKTLLFYAMLLVISSSCSKNDDFTEKPNPVKLSLWQITANEQIEYGEIATITITIDNPNNYIGGYKIRYSQKPNNGWGVLSYANEAMKNGEIWEFDGDVIQLQYKAESENYHKIDFTLYNDANDYADFSVIFNENKKGIEDTFFTVSSSLISDQIIENQRASIKLKIIPSKMASDIYFIKYNQYLGQGFGELRNGGVLMIKDKVYPINGNETVLEYKALSTNYHLLNFEVTDDIGGRVQHDIEFNLDRKGIPDEGFIITHQSLEPLVIGDNYFTYFLKKIDLNYNGKYFIKAHIVRGYGHLKMINEQKKETIELDTGVAHELSLMDDNSFTIRYYNYSGYPQTYIILSFWDEIGNKFEVELKSNED